MITRVDIKGCGCIRDATLSLGKLTVLVGPNGSGKSTAMRALDPHAEHTRWRGLRSEDPKITMSRDVGESFSRTARPGIPTRAPAWLRYQLIRFDLGALRAPNMVQAAHALDGRGANLPNFVASLSRKQQEELASQFHELVPSIGDVGVVPTGQGGYHQLRFEDHWQKDLWFDANQVSDGTLLVLSILALQFQRPEPAILAVEEPERALHPYLLGEVIKVFRRLTDRDPPIQIILATHSAELLEFVKPEEVRFFSRSPEDGSTQIATVPPEDENWRQTYREYDESLGALWLSGNLGGVPGGH